MTADPTPMDAPAEAVRLVLELRGPLPPAAVADALAALEVDLGGEALDDLLARAGAVRVAGPGDRDLVALARGPAAEPRALVLLRSAPPALLAGLVVAVVLVAALLLAGLNDGAREGPTLEYRPPPTTGG